MFLHKLTHWEYWPFGVVYFPMFFAWFYYAIKARTLFFFLPANPLIKNAGFLLESKKEIYDSIPAMAIPKTLFFQQHSTSRKILDEMIEAGIGFPCIAKPDIGMKGLAVSRLENAHDLCSYLSKIKVDFLIQEYISLPNEMGVFYYRFPGKPSGNISGIVHKELLSITGDGTSSMEELLLKDPRYQFQIPALRKIYGAGLGEIPGREIVIDLVPYGNHARGAKFTDSTAQADAQLVAFIDQLCRQVPEFYYGRLDLKYNTIEELKQGKNFCIIELNGAGSEPTHIYDPAHSLLFAWKEILRHYRLLWEISMKNHQRGIPHMPWREGLKMLRGNVELVKKLKAF
ncbi:MAG: D-alanine--D-alanine ligase [Pedobacter sp.]|nr:MAG: D-alanine--D-alanine ligase [Pedobacter sp.]